MTLQLTIVISIIVFMMCCITGLAVLGITESAVARMTTELKYVEGEEVTEHTDTEPMPNWAGAAVVICAVVFNLVCGAIILKMLCGQEILYYAASMKVV